MLLECSTSIACQLSCTDSERDNGVPVMSANTIVGACLCGWSDHLRYAQCAPSRAATLSVPHALKTVFLLVPKYCAQPVRSSNRIARTCRRPRGGGACAGGGGGLAGAMAERHHRGRVRLPVRQPHLSLAILVLVHSVFHSEHRRPQAKTCMLRRFPRCSHAQQSQRAQAPQHNPACEPPSSAEEHVCQLEHLRSRCVQAQWPQRAGRPQHNAAPHIPAHRVPPDGARAVPLAARLRRCREPRGGGHVGARPPGHLRERRALSCLIMICSLVSSLCECAARRAAELYISRK